MNTFPTVQEALDRYGPIMTIKDVMQVCSVGKPTATRICLDSECPKVPRKKNQQFCIYTAKFINWMADKQGA